MDSVIIAVLQMVATDLHRRRGGNVLGEDTGGGHRLPIRGRHDREIGLTVGLDPAAQAAR